ncbi:hypothetical protein A3C89_01120 [Candidatus Kaiserbacteria bacterium RIFCSPHIGHO2_02_FULL_50_50]|uniref:DUF1905 domain-containing protein n=1 Tax=Candidatus Kaiserbacteria bacterium RIFCSPHIGHO2_02_FULL_50_50 TaxID=1798492 RepID=A0A1F6DDN3_9BACT|nr:MAG: hypothetical protein A3C89_01120 [Candidatus Kaiserbacteria bacterium RIFCSPHIGHO2_02_FULL_50_50]OGG88723.1 MAG: hypothetical protein A3G62_00520 [Candidatus Kaiserbacteria bacterium RIFCSPLOWO2_12_FULL_50_10]
MNTNIHQIKFSAKLWIYPGAHASWHFVSVPEAIAAPLREKYKRTHKGWNSLPVEVTIGETTWRTSMFFDTKSTTYLLPIKSQVRKKEALLADELLDVGITINHSV